MTSTKNLKMVFCMIAVTAIIALAIMLAPTAAYAQETETMDQPQAEEQTTQPEETAITTTPATVVMNAEIRSLPSADGEVVGNVSSGKTVEIYTTMVNGEWNAILDDTQTMRYIHYTATSNTAPMYDYEYGSDLTRITNYTPAQIENALAGTKLAGLGAAYANAEKQYGVNALFLVAITKLESASGSSGLATRQNNLGGLKNGNGGYLSFDSKEACIDYMGRLLSEKYLTPSGKYYKGNSVQSVSIRYCEQSASWTGSVENLMNSSYRDIMSV